MQQSGKEYKLTEPGEIPEEWSMINLGDRLELRSGKSNPSKNLVDSNPIPVYGGNGITGFYTDYLMKESTIVIGRVGEYCGSVNLTKGKAWITDNAIYISKLDDSISVTYLYYFLLLYNVGKFAEKTGQPKLTQLPIKQIKIPLPSVTEQQEIASVLSKVDELIKKTDQVIEQTQRLKKGLMQRLLTKGIGHTKFNKTSTGEIPENWNIFFLSEMCSIRKRDTISSNLYIGLEHIGQGDNNLVSRGNSKDFTSNKHVFHKGDVLYGKLRPNLNKTYLASEDGYCSTDILPLALKETILGEILLWVLSSNRFVDHAVSTSSGTKMPRTSWNDMKDFKILLPPLVEQQKIISIVSKITSLVENHQKHRFHMEYLKKELMQKLLTGQIRVKV